MGGLSLPMAGATGAFLLAFPALFSIVNPIGGALVFGSITASRTHAERVVLARRIATYSLFVLLASLWLGSYVLSFFGISMGALRVAGGIVVALRAWDLLSQPERQESAKQRQAAPAEGSEEEVAFFPLTVPFTTGPGTIAVAVALGAGRPHEVTALGSFFVGVTAGALAIAAVIWLLYHEADRVMSLLGPTRARVVTRLVAFLLLCIGVQILSQGVQDLVEPFLARMQGAGGPPGPR